MIFNFSITKYLKQAALLFLTIVCFCALQGFTTEKEEVKIKDATLISGG